MSRRHLLRFSLVDLVLVVLFCGLFAALSRSHGETALAILLLIWAARVVWTLYKTSHVATRSCVECGRLFPPITPECGENLWRVGGQVVWNLASVVLTFGIFFSVLMENFSWGLNTPPGKPPSPLAGQLVLSIMATMLVFFVARVRLWYSRARFDAPMQEFEHGPGRPAPLQTCLECRLARLGEREARSMRAMVSNRLQFEAFFGTIVVLAVIACFYTWARIGFG